MSAGRDKKVHGKRYSIAQKLAIKALQDTGLSPHHAAPIAGADRSTVMRIWEDPELDNLSPEIVNKVKTGMTGLFYKRSLQGLLSMTPEKFRESSLLQTATAVGIMTEKGRLMSGESTGNLAHTNLIANIDMDRQRIMEKIDAIDVSEGDRT